MAKEPNPTDLLVGENIRLKRSLLGLTQSLLAQEIGVTFQQVQKYERGINKIGASRLDQIAKILKVTPAFFFQDCQTAGKTAQEEKWSYDAELKRMIEFLDTPDGATLVSNFMRIEDFEMRKRIIDLVISVGNFRRPEKPDDNP